MTKFIKQTSGLFLLLLLVSSTSCKKLLDLKPLDGIVRQEFWKTEEELQSALVGCYTSLATAPTGTSDRPIQLSVFLWGELRADMIVPTDASTTQEQRDIKDIVNVNITPANTLITWSAFYRTINYCNTVLDNAPNVRKNDPTITEANYNRYVGEALAIRSLMYFYLLRTFGDVPLRLESVSDDEDIKEIGKAPQAEVLAQILKDLKTAQAGLPEKYGTNVQVNKGRFTKLGATALLADVLLWNEQYDECIAECDKVLDYVSAHPTELGLVAATSNWYNTVFSLGSSRETIFEISNSTSINNPFGDFLASSNRRLLANNYVLELFAPDPDDPENLRPDIRAQFFSVSGMLINRLATESVSFNNFQIYRLSDIMLIKAEALAFSPAGRGGEALPILANLRSARNAVITTQRNPDPSNAEEVGEYVLEERAREFAFEGKRWFDLLRYAKRNNYANPSYLSNIVGKTVAPSGQQSAIAKYQDRYSHYLPINQADIFADQSLVQNPFYNR